MSDKPVERRRGGTDFIHIDAPEPGYAGSIASLIARIARTSSGRVLLKNLGASGSTIRIGKPDPPTKPPNAWAQLRGRDVAEPAILIAYDPADWPNLMGGDATSRDIVLFRLLVDAAMMAVGIKPPEDTDPAGSPDVAAYLLERGDQ